METNKLFVQSKDKFEEKAQADTLHFWDGERKIDMVLAFEDDENGPEDIRKAEKRKTFQRNLEEQGLELELEPSHRSADKKTNFLKISAPWELLTKYAEILNLKMPIKVRKNTVFYFQFSKREI